MNTKFLKHFVIGVLVLGWHMAYAHFSNSEELAPTSCSKMSKNPECGKTSDHAEPSCPDICPAKESCNVIQSVHQDDRGQFQCKGVNGALFSCDNLVKEFGVQIEGVAVKVTTTYADGCHKPGVCGPKACIPIWGTASLDPACTAHPLSVHKKIFWDDSF